MALAALWRQTAARGLAHTPEAPGWGWSPHSRGGLSPHTGAGLAGVQSLAFTRAAASSGFFWPGLGCGEMEAVLEVSGVSVGLGLLGDLGTPHGVGPMTGSETQSWRLFSGVTLGPCVRRPPCPSCGGSLVSPAGPAALSWWQRGRLSPLRCPPAEPAAPGVHLGVGVSLLCLPDCWAHRTLASLCQMGGPVRAASSRVMLGTHMWPSLEAQGQAGQDILTPWAGGTCRLLGCVWTHRVEEVRESLRGMWAWL